MAKPDALRASLDQRQVNRKARAEREYVESVLRRLGPSTPVATPTAKKAATPVAAPAAVPAFDRVKPVKHAKTVEAEKKAAEEDANAVAFKQVSKRQQRKAAKLAAKQAAQEQEEEPVMEDLEEALEHEPQGHPPNRAIGYMKGNFALLRRQMDSDHAVYFFATEVPDDAQQSRVPSGYEVRLTPETNLPYIARRGSKDNVTVQVRAKDRAEAMELAARKGVGGLQGE